MTKQDVELIREAMQFYCCVSDSWKMISPEQKAAMGDALSRLDQIAEDARVGRAVREEDPRIIEALAAQSHVSWSGWMEWMFEKFFDTHQPSGVPFLLRWIRQMKTPYTELSSQEQESDREEARGFLKALMAAGLVKEEK